MAACQGGSACARAPPANSESVEQGRQGWAEFPAPEDAEPDQTDLGSDYLAVAEQGLAWGLESVEQGQDWGWDCRAAD